MGRKGSLFALLGGIQIDAGPMESSMEISQKLKMDVPQHKQINKQTLERMRRKGNPSTLLVGMQIGAATVENSMEFPQKTKNGTAF